ncbi:HNH endonuclease [Burkholderia pseudomallei]
MAVILTSKGKQILVDDADFEELSRFTWHMNHGYAVRNAAHPFHAGKQIVVRMHRQLMGLEYRDPREVDHRNGNKADNRRMNLRVCTKAKNHLNRGLRPDSETGFKGVNWMPLHRKWRARIQMDGKRAHLGLFETAEEAHAAYCKAADDLHGEFANYGL